MARSSLLLLTAQEALRSAGLRRLTVGLTVFGASLGLPAVVSAAEVTEVLDADDGDDPFDFRAEVQYRRTLRRAKITREFNCGARAVDVDTCPNAGPAGELVQVKELRYQRWTHEMVPTVRFGLWHDLELKIEAPLVLSDTQQVRFAGNGGDINGDVITPENSSIAPGPNGGVDPEDLFPVPTKGLPTRAGFGDMLFMLRWAPVSQERDQTRGDWVVEMGFRAATGKKMQFGNDSVGRGAHEVILATALSRRMKYSDPYARFEAVFPFASGDSLFKDYGDGQEQIGPGKRINFEFGSEFVPYQNLKKGNKFYFDLAMGATYHGEGRDYSELFDALAAGAQLCDPAGEGGARNCGRYNPDSQSEIKGTPHDGITTVEEYLTVYGRFGMGLFVADHLKLGISLQMAHDTEHFITNADIGDDLDGSGLVEARSDPGYNPAEQNPTYVQALDQVGRRLRVEETTVFTTALNAALMF